MIAAAIRTTAISTAVHAVTTLKQPRDVPGVRGVDQPAGTGRDSDIITVMHPALDGVQTVSNGSFPPNYEDLKAIRTALNAAIDQSSCVSGMMYFSSKFPLCGRISIAIFLHDWHRLSVLHCERLMMFCLHWYWLQHGMTTPGGNLTSSCVIPFPIRDLSR